MAREELRCVFDPAMVVLSIVVAYVGSYMAISLLEQLRLFKINVMDAEIMEHAEAASNTTEDNSFNGRSVSTASLDSANSNDVIVGKKRYLFNSKEGMKFAILATMACAVGGIGIWSMHMVSMAAMKLYYKDIRVPVQFHLGLTLFSLFAVVICCLIGMYIASEDILFAKNKGKIVEESIKHKSSEALQKMGKVTTIDILLIISHLSLHRIVLGGFIAATGISIMHYIGMEGMQFKGIIEWNYGIVAASVLLAIVAANAAFWVLFRFLSTFCDHESLRIIAALIFTAAKCSVHYTGMAAAMYYHDTELIEVERFASMAISQNQALSGALVACFVVSWAIIMLIFSDLRLSNQILNSQIYKAEDVIGKVKMDPRIIGATSSILKKYQFFKPTKAAMMAVQRKTDSTNKANAAKLASMNIPTTITEYGSAKSSAVLEAASPV